MSRENASAAAEEVFALSFRTDDGFPLAVGGICRAGYRAHWMERMASLQHIRMTAHGLYEIDFALAKAIEQLGDDTLLIAGCSIDTAPPLAVGQSTGGIIGSPREEILSSQNSIDVLPEGYALYSASGGPGFAAKASPRVVSACLPHIRGFGRNPERDRALPDLLRANGISIGLLVSDGSGPLARGCVCAFSAQDTYVLHLHNML